MATRINYTFTQIEYVLAVHKHGHFAKAAEACHVTQPTLSMQIQKLEEDLGVIIFDRSKKPILLTAAGEKLIEQFKSVLNEAKKIEAIVESGQNTQTTGKLVVGVIPTIAPYLLPGLLKTLEKEAPNLELTIYEMQTDSIIEALNNDEIDVGILATPLKVPKIHELPLYYEPFSVLCKKGHELSRQKKVKNSDLKLDDIWLLQEGHCLRNQMLDVCALKDTKSANRKFSFESGSLETLKSLVETYGGYTLLPAMAVDKLGRQATIVPFDRPIPAREVGLVYRREHYKSDLIQTLADAILQSIPEEIRKIKAKDLDVLPIEP